MTAPSLRIDSHQHFWLRERGDYLWLRDDCEVFKPLLRNFEPRDLAPLLDAHLIEQTILVQAAATAGETDFLLQLADQHAFIVGVVGWVDLSAPDVEEQLARRSAQPKFKGIRPMLQDLADPYWIAQPTRLIALRHLQDLGLRLDALVRPHHLHALTQSLQYCPQLPAVINHAGKPQLGCSWDAAWADTWRRNMRSLAALPLTMCKFSGLLTEASQTASTSPAAAIAAVRPVWDALLEWFGPRRLMWGSDWPVLLLASDFDRWILVCETLIGELSPYEQTQIWAGNAQHFYGLQSSPTTLRSP